MSARTMAIGVVIGIWLSTYGAAARDDEDDGSLSKVAIMAVVKAHMIAIKDCYERELTKHPTLNGAIDLWWKIERDGRVSSVKVISSTMNNKEVEGCILAEISRWTFPKAPAATTVIRFPFVFKGGAPPKAAPDGGATAPPSGREESR